MESEEGEKQQKKWKGLMAKETKESIIDCTPGHDGKKSSEVMAGDIGWVI